jgi:AbrB family looped-hinge helix DNA binding protein
MANVVGERFQITIDKRLRDELGVQPGDLAIERVEDGRLMVTFVPRPHRESLLGALRKPGTEPIRDWQGLKEDVWRKRSREILDGMRARR